MAVCSSCGKCGTTACTADTQCNTASGEKCIVNSACAAAGQGVCLNLLDTCYGTLTSKKREALVAGGVLEAGAHGSYDAALY